MDRRRENKETDRNRRWEGRRWGGKEKETVRRNCMGRQERVGKQRGEAHKGGKGRDMQVQTCTVPSNFQR